MGLRLLLLVVCAGALVEASKSSQAKDYEAPPYFASAKAYKYAKDTLQRLTPSQFGHLPPTDARHHYGLFVAVLDDLFKVLGNPCAPHYDEYYYESVDKVVPGAYDHTDAVGRLTDEHLQEVDRNIYRVLYVQEHECQNYTEKQCDLKVQNRVENNPKDYQKQAKTLLEVGKLSKLYLEDTFETEAQNYDVLKALTTGKSRLKPLVLQGVVVRKQLYFDQSSNAAPHTFACPDHKG